MRSAFTKWTTSAPSGKYRRAKVVFPAPFGPAMTMHRGRLRWERILGLFIWRPASNSPSGAMPRNRGALPIRNQTGCSEHWAFEPVTQRNTRADLRRRLTENRRSTLPHWPAHSRATSSPAVARKRATGFGCARRSPLRLPTHDARVAGRAKRGGFRESPHSAPRCDSPGRVSGGYTAAASVSARRRPALSSRVRLQSLKVPYLLRQSRPSHDAADCGDGVRVRGIHYG